MRQVTLITNKPEWQSLVALVDDEDFDRVNQHHWNIKADINGLFYAKARINGVWVYMHRFLLGASPSDPQVDHQDHNGLHNWRSNIRFATNSQNQANCRLRFGGTSLFKGVYFRKRTSRWESRVRFEQTLVNLGTFGTEVEAAQAYNVFALEHHGEFVCLNIIP